MEHAFRMLRAGPVLAIALISALFPATTIALSVDVSSGAVSADDAGDALLFPLYTTAAGAASSFSVSSTSPLRTLAVKIRYREQEHSMSVLGLIVVLSPDDKFDFYVSQPGDDARPTLRWSDNSCVVGPDVGATSLQFPVPSPFVDDAAAMSFGHVEVIGMADLSDAFLDVNANGLEDPGESLAAAARHDSTGVPADCGLIVDAFSDRASVVRIIGATDVANVLIGRFLVTGTGVGVEGGGNATALRDTFAAPYLAAQSSETCDGSTSCPANGLGYAWDDLEADHPHLGDAGAVRVDNLDRALGPDSLQADWSNNPANFVGVDWILTFPTKYLYLDRLNATCDAGSTGTTWCLVEELGLHNPFGPPGSDLCRDGSADVWDRDERLALPGVITIWGGWHVELCDETTVLTFAELGDTPRNSLIQTADRRVVVNFENLSAVRGRAELRPNWYWTGLPAPGVPRPAATLGVAFTARATDDPTINNGSVTELSRVR